MLLRCDAGLTGLQSLSLVDCAVRVSEPGPGWDRLRQLSKLELNGGILHFGEARTRGKLAYNLKCLHSHLKCCSLACCLASRWVRAAFQHSTPRRCPCCCPACSGLLFAKPELLTSWIMRLVMLLIMLSGHNMQRLRCCRSQFVGLREIGLDGLRPLLGDLPQERLQGCCAGQQVRRHEGWQTDTLRLSPQYACLLSSSSADRATTFDVPASVRVLHLLSCRGIYYAAGHRPMPTGPGLRQLHVDLNAWDAKPVRMPACHLMLLLGLRCAF